MLSLDELAKSDDDSVHVEFADGARVHVPAVRRVRDQDRRYVTYTDTDDGALLCQIADESPAGVCLYFAEFLVVNMPDAAGAYEPAWLCAEHYAAMSIPAAALLLTRWTGPPGGFPVEYVPGTGYVRGSDPQTVL